MRKLFNFLRLDLHATNIIQHRPRLGGKRTASQPKASGQKANREPKPVIKVNVGVGPSQMW